MLKNLNSITFYRGDFRTAYKDEVWQSCDVVFVNNAGDILSGRSDIKEGQQSFDECLSIYFASAKYGFKLVTMNKILMLGASEEEEEEIQRAQKRGRYKAKGKKGHKPFFKITELNLGADAVTWSKNCEVIAYIYEKTSEALFVCQCGVENSIVREGKLNYSCCCCNKVSRKTNAPRDVAKKRKLKLKYHSR